MILTWLTEFSPEFVFLFRILFFTYFLLGKKKKYCFLHSTPYLARPWEFLRVAVTTLAVQLKWCGEGRGSRSWNGWGTLYMKYGTLSGPQRDDKIGKAQST